jgi:hypothetical protein
MKIAKCIIQHNLGELVKRVGLAAGEVDRLLEGRGGRGTTPTEAIEFSNGYQLTMKNGLATVIYPNGSKDILGYVTSCGKLAEHVNRIGRL